MSASLPFVDRRPTPTVVIIGNDTVLAAAPASPVQLAHACLRRGFSVAVPASWGDEILAAEAVRRLASRERGPAVMCVCPYARSRLLAPGPDLAPFLVSLVPPPVAAARYLRTVYGEHGIHITYVGACPGAEDSTIDARLTPEAFLADIAEHGISLLEQPLVFDSIVPPDRRRWCSLPGGVPTPEILWGETDTRTLIEIERDEISTDLAQHIITREHVLLDLAPGLGCVCSGAISSLPSRSARVAVTALEPPRALAPVIDPGTIVSLDVPLSERPVQERGPFAPEPEVGSVPPDAPSLNEELERRLDEILGLPIPQGAEALERELEAEPDVELFADIAGNRPSEEPERRDPTVSTPEEAERSVFERPFAEPVMAEVEAMFPDSPLAAESVEAVDRAQAIIVVLESETHAEPIVPTPELAVEPSEPQPVVSIEHEPWDPPAVSSIGANGTAHEADASADSPVRRRTPPPIPARHPASAIPKATASDGRALPRAYVAKRRTPPGGATVVSASPRPAETEVPRALESESPVATPTPPPTPGAPPSNASGGPASATSAELAPLVADSAQRAPARDVSAPTKQPAEPRTAGAGVTSTADDGTNRSALIVLLLALIALGFFVLRSLG